VTKTATVSMHANLYEVDAALVGRKVELVFDPFDLAVIEVRWNSRPMGHAVAVRIGRHAHPHARPETPTPPPTGTGIDYLALVEARRDRHEEHHISYSAIGTPTIGDQLSLPCTWEHIGPNTNNDEENNQ
jgi:putative transposase